MYNNANPWQQMMSNQALPDTARGEIVDAAVGELVQYGVNPSVD